MQDNENELSILETIAKTVQKLGADDCDAICVSCINGYYATLGYNASYNNAVLCYPCG